MTDYNDKIQAPQSTTFETLPILSTHPVAGDPNESGQVEPYANELITNIITDASRVASAKHRASISNTGLDNTDELNSSPTSHEIHKPEYSTSNGIHNGNEFDNEDIQKKMNNVIHDIQSGSGDDTNISRRSITSNHLQDGQINHSTPTINDSSTEIDLTKKNPTNESTLVDHHRRQATPTNTTTFINGSTDQHQLEQENHTKNLSDDDFFDRTTGTVNDDQQSSSAIKQNTLDETTHFGTTSPKLPSSRVQSAASKRSVHAPPDEPSTSSDEKHAQMSPLKLPTDTGNDTDLDNQEVAAVVRRPSRALSPLKRPRSPTPNDSRKASITMEPLSSTHVKTDDNINHDHTISSTLNNNESISPMVSNDNQENAEEQQQNVESSPTTIISSASRRDSINKNDQQQISPSTSQSNSSHPHHLSTTDEHLKLIKTGEQLQIPTDDFDNERIHSPPPPPSPSGSKSMALTDASLENDVAQKEQVHSQPSSEINRKSPTKSMISTEKDIDGEVLLSNSPRENDINQQQTDINYQKPASRRQSQIIEQTEHIPSSRRTSNFQQQDELDSHRQQHTESRRTSNVAQEPTSPEENSVPIEQTIHRRESTDFEQKSPSRKGSIAPEKQIPSKRASITSEHQTSNRRESITNEPQLSNRRESMVPEQQAASRRGSTAPEQQAPSRRESIAPEQQASSRRGSTAPEQQAPSRRGSIAPEQQISSRRESITDVQKPTSRKGSTVFEQQSPSRRGSIVPEQQISSRRESITDVQKPTSRKGSTVFEQQPSSKRGSAVSEHEPPNKRESISLEQQPSSRRGSIVNDQLISNRRESITHEPQTSSRRGSTTYEQHISNRRESTTNEPQISSKRDSVVHEQYVSGRRESTTNEPQLSNKRGSIAFEHEPSSKRGSIVHEQYASGRRESTTNEPQLSSKRGSIAYEHELPQKRESITTEQQILSRRESTTDGHKIASRKGSTSFQQQPPSKRESYQDISSSRRTSTNQDMQLLSPSHSGVVNNISPSQESNRRNSFIKQEHQPISVHVNKDHESNLLHRDVPSSDTDIPVQTSAKHKHERTPSIEKRQKSSSTVNEDDQNQSTFHRRSGQQSKRNSSVISDEIVVTPIIMDSSKVRQHSGNRTLQMDSDDEYMSTSKLPPVNSSSQQKPHQSETLNKQKLPRSSRSEIHPLSSSRASTQSDEERRKHWTKQVAIPKIQLTDDDVGSPREEQPRPKSPNVEQIAERNQQLTPPLTSEQRRSIAEDGHKRKDLQRLTRLSNSVDSVNRIRVVDDKSLGSTSDNNSDLEINKRRRIKPKKKDVETNTDETYYVQQQSNFVDNRELTPQKPLKATKPMSDHFHPTHRHAQKNEQISSTPDTISNTGTPTFRRTIKLSNDQNQDNEPVNVNVTVVVKKFAGTNEDGTSRTITEAFVEQKPQQYFEPVQHPLAILPPSTTTEDKEKSEESTERPKTSEQHPIKPSEQIIEHHDREIHSDTEQIITEKQKKNRRPKRISRTCQTYECVFRRMEREQYHNLRATADTEKNIQTLKSQLRPRKKSPKKNLPPYLPADSFRVEELLPKAFHQSRRNMSKSSAIARSLSPQGGKLLILRPTLPFHHTDAVNVQRVCLQYAIDLIPNENISHDTMSTHRNKSNVFKHPEQTSSLPMISSSSSGMNISTNKSTSKEKSASNKTEESMHQRKPGGGV
ncbi:unnamed protein product [Rotaria sordida]|uniref:Uncharacterized protein n=1 Tax=Rotaria sordida TaxID=392033 RepID=A0A818M875_9BILA|nr:unnamed protein product [Rotaria sordida]